MMEMRIRYFPLIIILPVLLWGGLSQGREVNTPAEALRLDGWDGYRQGRKKIDEDRLAGVQDTKKTRLEYEKQQEEILKEYKLSKKKQRTDVDEMGPEYTQHMNQKKEQFRLVERLQQDYIAERINNQKKYKKSINLSEATELGLNDKSARVPWNKRNFIAKDGVKGGGATPYTPPANDFYDTADSAPPPPPPSIPENNLEDFPPPPPPPIFDDESPF